MSEPTKITAVHIKLKSIDLIDDLLNAVAGTEDDGELSAVDVLTEIKRLIIQDWLEFDAIPRAKVQAAVDEMNRKETDDFCDDVQDALDWAIARMAHHTGVTPSEVQG